VKVALDTSVLVAAAVEDHPRHSAAISWIRTRRRIERIASWHAFAEAWAVLTVLPVDPPVTGETARLVLDRLGKLVRFVTPTGKIYGAAAARCAAQRMGSGAIFDAIHVVTAEVEGASSILTYDEADFVRLAGPELRVLVPSAAPP
jgi:predicted nucleic acid-binding protein